MRSLFIATASALFFAYVITELSLRLWPGNYFHLLLVAFVCLWLSGLLNLRLAGWGSGASAERRPDEAQPPQPRRTPRQPRQPAAQAGPRETGTVKWFNRSKGFGFVIRDSGEEIFVHQRSIRAAADGDGHRRPALRDGQAVTFVVAERQKGLQAEDVVPVE